jgi:hypothetical protein
MNITMQQITTTFDEDGQKERVEETYTAPCPNCDNSRHSYVAAINTQGIPTVRLGYYRLQSVCITNGSC